MASHLGCATASCLGGGCRRRSCLGKSAVAAPTLDGVAVMRSSRVDPRARASREPPQQPLPPRLCARLRGAVVAHVPPRSAVAPPQPLPLRCRARLKGPLPRAPQGDAVAVVPPGIRRRGRCHLAIMRTSGGRRRTCALGIRRRNRDHAPPDLSSHACS